MESPYTKYVDLARTIVTYWRRRGFDKIQAWVEKDAVAGFRIASNLGANGYPPR